VTAIASRYGLRLQDFTMAWDEGSFEASRVEHDLLIIRKDGSRANVRIDGDTLLRRDTWMYFRDLEAAFTQLNRRKFLRLRLEIPAASWVFATWGPGGWGCRLLRRTL